MTVITAQLKNLLDAIGEGEAPKGYGQIFGGAKGVPKNTDVSKMTLDAVRALQAKMVKAGSKSTACGRYQFIRKTLAVTVEEMGLKGSDVWTPALQDRMAVRLIEKRGLNRFLAGTISREAFANNLAAEWASLPMATGPLKGKSKYDGDGLNHSSHTVAEILSLLSALKGATADPMIGADSPPDLIKTLQKVLADREYNPGAVDGKWGKLTRAAVLALKGENGLDTSTDTILLSQATAAPKRVLEARQDATVSDLRKQGSGTIAGADKVQAAAAVAGGGGVLAKAADYLDLGERAKGIFEPFQGFMPWIIDNLWLVLPGAGAVAILFAYRAKKKRLAEYQTGKMG